MTIFTYLRSHTAAAICDGVAIALLAFLLPAIGVERDPALLTCIVCSLLLVAGGACNYLRERRFLMQLAELAMCENDALDTAAILDAPGYLEGDLTAEAIANVARDGRARANAARNDMAEYREYLETWVHELKTPLAAARLYLENRNDETLRPLRHEIDRVDRTVEQALYYARSFSVDRDYLVRPCALDKMVREALRSRSHELIEARVSVSLDGLAIDGTAPTVSCDAKWMTFILGQIIDNAVRYRPDPETDGRLARIEFGASIEQAGTAREQTLLTVHDNGCGIAEADLPRIFDRGFTGENGRNRTRSTGMGLYLVRTLCRKMGLEVWAASCPDEPNRPGWTRITIAFPQATDSNLADSDLTKAANLTKV